MFKVVDPNSSVYVELSASGVAHIAEFPPAEERAFVVGSTERASLRVSSVGVAPVQFHLEREDAAIWLIPAYGIADLSVNAIPVLGPIPLAERSVIEFCGVRVYAAIREADVLSNNDDRFVAHDSNAQADRKSYSLRLPGEGDSTVLAMPPVRPSEAPADEVPTGVVTRLATGNVERTGTREEIENARSLDNTTLRLAPFRAGPSLPHANRPILTSNGTEIMAPYRPTASEIAAAAPAAGPLQRDLPPAPQHGPTPEPVSPPVAAHGNTPRCESRPRGARALAPPATNAQPRDRALEGRGVASDSHLPSPSVPVIPLASPTSVLSGIGLLTKARPFLVLGGASIGALVLALTLLGAARLIEKHRAAPAAQSAPDGLTGAESAAQPEATVLHQERSNAAQSTR